MTKKHAVTHFPLEEIPQIGEQSFNLFFNIDDGLKYRFPRHLQTSIYGAIDTHIRPEWNLEKDQDFTHVFCAQKRGADWLRQGGIRARWCPLAFNPEIHRKHFLPKILDVFFVGHFGASVTRDFFGRGKRYSRKEAS